MLASWRCRLIHNPTRIKLTFAPTTINQFRPWTTAISRREPGRSKNNVRSEERKFPLLQTTAPKKWNGFSTKVHTDDIQAYIALGSNVGDRIANIESALSEMRARGLNVTKVSNLYETKAMYYEDQASFLNGVCQVETQLEPLALLDTLKDIEKSLGRVKLIEKGPRNIDLDILMYGLEQVHHERLIVPHQLMLEREFVLKPLLEILSEDSHQLSHGIFHTLDRALRILEVESTESRPFSVTVLDSRHPFIRPTDPRRSSHIMAILNVTPDSFSDGGFNDPLDLPGISATVQRFIAEGATMVDIGGQSTRPNAELMTPEEELSRILPAIRHIRSMPEARNLIISVDTFYAKVAKESIAAGAHVINDISGGLLDEEMLPTIAKLGKSIILMHMRGTPKTMTKLTNYPAGLVEGVGAELQNRVEAAEAAGIPRWRIILDPGIGFAKSQYQNLELLRRLHELRNRPSFSGLSWLVGVSRKGFIGKITGVQSASDRTWGTAAAVTASIAGGADIVRVHDVAEMRQVAKLADAIYRVRQSSEADDLTSSK